MVVTINNIPSTPTAIFDALCAGEELILKVVNAPSSISYTWTNTSNQTIGTGNEITVTSSATSADEQTYSVVAVQNNCPSTAGTVFVSLKPTPSPSIVQGADDITNQTVIICLGVATDLTVANTLGNETITWTRNGTSTIGTNQTVTISESGEYEVKADNGTCSATVSTIIDVQEIEVVAQASATAIDLEESVDLSGNVTGDIGNSMTYVWSDENQGKTYPNSLSITITPEQTDTYQLLVTDQVTGCNGTSESQEVIVYLPLQIPNAFTPNGDGINDVWVIEGLESYPDATVLIYNRWGQKIYEKRGGFDYWDGVNLNGKDVTTSTFYYIIYLGDERGLKIQGDVSVIR
jgi:gliding motility-associated-like protein